MCQLLSRTHFKLGYKRQDVLCFLDFNITLGQSLRIGFSILFSIFHQRDRKLAKKRRATIKMNSPSFLSVFS